MTLPCIAFLLPSYSHWQSRRTRLGRIYRIDTATFGMVEIKTKQDLSRMAPLYLIHPWLNSLLQREDRGSVDMEEDAPPPSPDTDDEDFYDEYKDDDEYSDDDEELSDGDIDDYFSVVSTPESHDTPGTALMDRETGARRLIARLRRPFGALLLTETSSGGRVPDYRWIAADSLITVRFQDGVPLADVLNTFALSRFCSIL